MALLVTQVTGFPLSESESEETSERTLHFRGCQLIEYMPDVLLKQLQPTTNPLRQTDERSVEFEELKDSIEECGVLQPLLVRPLSGGKTSCDYEIVDGMHRYCAAKQIGLNQVPCIVEQLTDDDVLRLQIECNAHRLETTPIDYARRFRAILRRHPNLTQTQLGRMVHKSAAWVRNTLGLLRLEPSVAKSVERGEIPLKSAYLLTQLTHTLQKEWHECAMSQTSRKFEVLIRPVIADQQSNAATPSYDTFNPVAHLRGLKHITREIDVQEQAAVVLAAEGVDNILDAFVVGLKWVTHTDIISIRKYEHEYRTRHATETI